MAEAVALLLDPSDTSRGYIVWDHGAVIAFGGAPPTDAAIMFTDRVIGAQIEDWTTPSGAVYRSDGLVVPFGGSAWSEPATLDAWPIVRAVHMNPSGANQGYRMLADGTIEKWGVGTPDPSWEPTPNGTNTVRDWALEWATGRSIVLRMTGSMQSSTGITGYDGVVKPGRDVYRALAIREWDATPGFWVADYAGDVFKGNGAEDAPPSRHWPGRDVVRDLAVVSDGLGGNPLTLAILTAWGGIHRWTVSDPPTVTVVAPVSPVTDTTRPQVQWEYADTNGDGQAAYHVVLVTEAVGDGVGFDPADTDDAIATWYGTDRTVMAVDLEVDLANGDYSVFVRAADTAGSLSAWDDHDFTVAVTAPATPTIDVTAAGPWAVAVVVAGVDADGTAETEFTDDPPEEVVRTWLTVRDSGGTPDLDGEVVLTDREPRLNRRRWYRAMTRVDGVASEWSEEDSALVVEDALWVLSAPLELADPVAVDIAPPFTFTEPIPAGVHRPPGRRNAIVVRGGGRQSAETPLKIRTLDADAHDALRYLLDGSRPLLLRSPYGQHWFCEAHGDLSTEMLDALEPQADETTEMRHAHDTGVTLVEVDRP